MSARKKVTIVGGGQTGGIMAYRLAEKNICDIVIRDVPEFAQHHGKARLRQGRSLEAHLGGHLDQSNRRGEFGDLARAGAQSLPGAEGVSP